MREADPRGGWRGHPGTTSTSGRLQARGLVVVKDDPFNAESPLPALAVVPTPAAQFYVRSHFSNPVLDAGEWRLRLGGGFDRPVELAFAELTAMPSRTLQATMECAGNDRIGFAPLPPGEPWGAGAVSFGVWRGVPLADILGRAGLQPGAVELLFEGADQGQPEGSDSYQPFLRSLPLEKACDPDTLLTYELDGAPLTEDHGGPVRLLVPGWYGVASVKWLVRITALDQCFRGFFQHERYVIRRSDTDHVEPLREMLVKSLVTSMQSGDVIAPGRHMVAGIAWSGAGRITKVEISADGSPWEPARLLGAGTAYGWQEWEWEWAVLQPGRHVVRVRATDEHHNVQPDVAAWNELGYVNNAIQLVAVEAHPPN